VKVPRSWSWTLLGSPWTLGLLPAVFAHIVGTVTLIPGIVVPSFFPYTCMLSTIALQTSPDRPGASCCSIPLKRSDVRNVVVVFAGAVKISLHLCIGKLRTMGGSTAGTKAEPSSCLTVGLLL